MKRAARDMLLKRNQSFAGVFLSLMIWKGSICKSEFTRHARGNCSSCSCRDSCDADIGKAISSSELMLRLVFFG